MASGLAERGIVIVGELNALGRALARRAADAGAQVVISDHAPRANWAEDLPAKAQARVALCTADPGSESDVEKFFDFAVERFENIYAVIHNVTANPGLENRALTQVSLADWNKQLELNLRAPFLTSRRAVEEFLAGGEGGRLLYVCHAPDHAAPDVIHATAQTALHSLARTVAKEYGHRHIQCNVATVRLMTEPNEARVRALADSLLFLISDEASYVNGETIRL